MKYEKILLLQGKNGRKLIEKTLKKNNINVFVIECYKRIFKKFNVIKKGKKWSTDKINTLLITNSETMYELNRIFYNSDYYAWLLKCKILVVESRLSKIAKKIGWKHIIIANYANNEYLIEFIKQIKCKI